jgi:hypothetical protein
MTDGPISEPDRVCGDQRTSGDPARFRKQLPRTALHGVLRSQVILQNSNAQPSVGIWPSDIGSLAFARDEFFDVLDVLYLKRDGTNTRTKQTLELAENTPSLAHNEKKGKPETGPSPRCAVHSSQRTHPSPRKRAFPRAGYWLHFGLKPRQAIEIEQNAASACIIKVVNTNPEKSAFFA